MPPFNNPFANLFSSAPAAAPVAPVVPGAPPVQAAPVQPPAAGPTPPGNIPPNVDPNAPPAQPVPVVDPNAPPVVEPPMAEFAKLWDTPTIDPNAAAPTEPVALTAEAVQKVVANANFAGGVTSEVMATIAAGGEEAQKAMMLMLNQATQQAVTQSIMASSKLNEKAIADALAKQEATLPDLLRDQAANSHLNDLNPLFSNPAIKPVIDATRQQLLQKFPGDTPAQTAEKLQNFIVAMGAQFAPKEVVNDNASQETNWVDFMEKG
jgi:hypothetical protein